MQARLLTLSLMALAATEAAHAHVTVAASSPAIAGKTYEVTLNIPHGCAGKDTYKIEVNIPTGFMLARPVDAAFGKAAVTKAPLATPYVSHGTTYTEDVSKITWINPSVEADASGGVDTKLYKVSFRGTLPNTPFTKIFFPTVQTCHNGDAGDLTEAWVGTDSGEHDHSSSASTSVDPAPSLFIYPARQPGWNKYTVNQHVHDLSVFNDAEIVWAGNSAYSVNEVIKAIILQDESVAELDAIHPGTEIWVKY